MDSGVLSSVTISQSVESMGQLTTIVTDPTAVLPVVTAKKSAPVQEPVAEQDIEASKVC